MHLVSADRVRWRTAHSGSPPAAARAPRCRSSPAPAVLLEDRPAFHDEVGPLQHVDVVKRIILHRHQVGQLATHPSVACA